MLETTPHSHADTSVPATPFTAPAVFWPCWIEWAAVVLIGLAYFNAPAGDWVYDDNMQIVQNRLIQDIRLLPTALVSDVWAFHGQRDKPWSNYWRPVFVLWLSMNYQVFGLWTPGWHLTSLLLHAVVTILAFRLLRRIGADPAVTSLATWVFAVHPVHVESVTWVSGVTDLLMSCFLLASYLMHDRAGAQPGGIRHATASCLLYVPALLSKEAAVCFPAIIFAARYVDSSYQGCAARLAIRAALRQAAPFIVIAGLYVFVRYLVLGQLRSTAPGAPGLLGMMATVPSLIVFYLRQTFFPLLLGPDNPLRPVTNSTIGLMNFVFPLAMLIVLINVVRPMLRKNRLYAHGLIWFLLPLLLALDIRVFLPDQIVNNRYLYLSVLGGFLFAGQLLRSGFELALKHTAGVRRAVYIVGLVIAVAMIPLTHDYNKSWSDEIALWERGTRTDPASPHAYAQLGEAYRQARRWDEAKTALQKAIEHDPDVTTPYISLGMIAIEQGQYSIAEERLRKVLAVFPDYAIALEQLAHCFQRQDRYDEAITVFREAIERLPFNRPRYMMNIAVLEAMAGRNAAALAALESILQDLEREDDPRLFVAWYYLGELYRQAGAAAKAADAYQRYLRLTAEMNTSEVLGIRAHCREALSALPQ